MNENKDIKGIKIVTDSLSLFYGSKQALKNISLDVHPQKVTALIGPSGCGKSTFLRSLNRMNDLIKNVKISGKVFIDGEDIYNSRIDVVNLRKRVGMVFQKPNPFPLSIFENVIYGNRLNGTRKKKKLGQIKYSRLRIIGRTAAETLYCPHSCSRT